MLVDVAQALQLPKGIDINIKRGLDPNLKGERLHTADQLSCPIAHTLESSSRHSLPAVSIVYDRKLVAAARTLPISENELPDDVIECGSQIVKDLPDPYGPLDRRDRCRAAIHPCLGVRILIDVMINLSLDGSAQRIHVSDECPNLSIGTSDLWSRAREISHKPHLDKFSPSNSRNASSPEFSTSHP